MDSHIDYSAQLRVVQYCLVFKPMLYRQGSEYCRVSVSVRAVPEFIVGEAGWQLNYSAKHRLCFAY